MSIGKKLRPIWKTNAELGVVDVASHGLTFDEMSRLASYNTEKAHGLVHTQAYEAKMVKLQRRFDEATK